MHRTLALYGMVSIVFSVLFTCPAIFIAGENRANIVYPEMDPLNPRFFFSPPSDACGPPGHQVSCLPHYVCVAPEGLTDYRICMSQAVLWERPNEGIHRLVTCCAEKRACPMYDMYPVAKTNSSSVPNSSEVAWIEKVKISQDELFAKISTLVQVPGTSVSEGCSKLHYLNTIFSGLAALVVIIQSVVFGVLVYRAHKSKLSRQSSENDGYIRDANNLQSFCQHDRFRNKRHARSPRNHMNQNCFRFCNCFRSGDYSLNNASDNIQHNLIPPMSTFVIDPNSSILSSGGLTNVSYMGCASPSYSKSAPIPIPSILPQNRGETTIDDGPSRLPSHSVLAMNTAISLNVHNKIQGKPSTSTANTGVKSSFGRRFVGPSLLNKSVSEKRSNSESSRVRWSDRAIRFFSSQRDCYHSDGETSTIKKNEMEMKVLKKNKQKRSGVTTTTSENDLINV